MWRLIAVACALFALGARANTLGDLKSAVGRLAARQPVHATYATDTAMKASGKFANESSTRRVTAEVGQDANGVTITIAQALIEKAGPGAGADDAKNEISGIRSMEIVEALNYRDALLHLLNYSTVAEEKRVPFRGRTARLLVMTVKEPLRKEGGINIGSVKSTEDRLSVWIGDENLPLAAERVQKIIVGFLMFKSESVNRTSLTFAQAGDRLILARLETSANGSAMGQSVDATSVQTLTVH